MGIPVRYHSAQKTKVGKGVCKGAPTPVARWAPELQRTKRTQKTQRGALDPASEALADP